MQSKYQLMAGVAALLIAAGHVQAAEVTVTASSGPVTLTAAGHPVAATVAAKLNLPLEIHTGATGTVDLLQLGSRVHVGPNSVLVLPDTATSDGPVDRILQKAGYVLYNIKTRKEHPLAVETPYLVSVVKGTVFTIAVEDHAATVALMEGSLDISAPGVTDHVLLKPNESIHHAQGEPQLIAHATAPAAFVPSGQAAPINGTALPDATNATQMAQVARDFADVGAAIAPSALLVSVRQVPTLQAGNSDSAGQTGSAGTSTGTTSSTSGSSQVSSGTTGSGAAPSGSSGSGSGSTGSSSGTGTIASSGSSGSSASSSGSTSTGSSSGTGTIASSGSSGSSASSSGSTSTGSSSGTGTTVSTGSTGTTGTTGATGITGTTGSSSSSASGTGSTASIGVAVAAGTSASGGAATVTVTLPSGTTTVTVGCNGKSNGTGQGKCLGHSKNSGG